MLYRTLENAGSAIQKISHFSCNIPAPMEEGIVKADPVEVRDAVECVPPGNESTMKTKKLFLLPALIAVLNLIPAGRVTAQTFTTLHSFAAGYNLVSSDDELLGFGNSDGLYPNSLVLSGNTLYGAAGGGGWGGVGAVFAVNTDGTGFTNLYNFALLDFHGFYVPPTNPDGANPNSLILSGHTLCGAASAGGWWARGTLFAMNTDGTGFTNLLQSGGWDSGFVLSGNTLY